jgi:hypothetical protein
MTESLTQEFPGAKNFLASEGGFHYNAPLFLDIKARQEAWGVKRRSEQYG